MATPKKKGPLKKTGPKKWIPTSEILEKIESLAMRQANWQQIGPNVGIHPHNLHEKRNEYPEISDAFNRGRAKGAALLINKGFEMAMDKDKEMMKLFLKAKCDFRETETLQTAVVPLSITVDGREFKIGS